MIITDEIRKAESDVEVYSLLASYIVAAGSRDMLTPLPHQIAALPIRNKDEVRTRFAALMLELDSASKQLDDETCSIVKEALNVFSAALHRLQVLNGRRSWPMYLKNQAAALTQVQGRI